MNDQLQVALTALLGRTLQGLEAGTVFLQAQLPDVIQQLLAWKAVVSGIWFATALVALATLLLVLVTKVWLNDEIDGESTVLITLLAIILAIPLAVIMASNTEWLQIWLAPKIFLIEYAAHLAK